MSPQAIDPRAPVREALAADRRIGPPPPRPPAGASRPAPAPPVRALPAPADREPTPLAPDADAVLPGTSRGGRQQVHLYVPRRVRQLLDAAARAGEGPPRPLGAVLAECLSATWRSIVADFEPRAGDAPDPFAPAGPARRLRVADPTSVHCQLTRAQAAALGEVCRRTGLPLAAVCTEAVERHLGATAGPGG